MNLTYRPRCWRVCGIGRISRKILKNQVPILTEGFSTLVGFVHFTGSCVCVCVCVLSCVWLFATPWTVAHQALLSMEFPRQEYWSGLPFPTPRDLLNSEVEPKCPAMAGRFFFFTTEIHLLFRNIHIHLVDYNLSKAKPGYHSFINFPTSYDHQHFLLIPQHKLESDNCQDRCRELLSSPYMPDQGSNPGLLHWES